MRESFAAYGARRGSTWSGPPSAPDLTAIANATRQGFTGHEMLDNLGLIHMNGRVYDPTIGRFLSADPFMDFGTGGQVINRYAYVGNNPLASIDPSGFTENQDEECHFNDVIACVDATAPKYTTTGTGYDEYASTTPQAAARGPSIETVTVTATGEPLVLEESDEEGSEPCSDFVAAIEEFTGGPSNQSFVDDVASNFVETKNFGLSDLASGLGADFSMGPNPGLDTATAIAFGGAVTRTYGGVTPAQALGQAIGASRSTISTPGLIGFRTVPSLVTTSAATWAINALLIKGMYNSGVLVGSVIRVSINRAASTVCSR